MKTDPIMEELRSVKDKLAREAGYDIDRFADNLRRWEATHPLPGRVIRTAEELRIFAAEEEAKGIASYSLNETPPQKT